MERLEVLSHRELAQVNKLELIVQKELIVIGSYEIHTHKKVLLKKLRKKL